MLNLKFNFMKWLYLFALMLILFSCSNKPKYLLEIDKLNGEYNIKSADESNEEKLYNLFSGSESFGSINFKGSGIGKLSMEVFLMKEVQDIEYSQSGDTLLIRILPNGSTLKYYVSEIKGEYDYIIAKLLNTDKDIVFVRK